MKKIKELIFELKESLEKEISEIGNKVEKLETRVSMLNPEGIAERIANIKKEVEESFSNSFEQSKKELEKLRNYVSKIEGRISLMDKIAQKISQISSSFGEKIKSFRAKKTKEEENLP